MSETDNYQNYWSGTETYKYESPKKPARSVKRKLAIVSVFLLILALTPSLIYALTNFDLDKGREVSVVVPQTTPAPINNAPEVHTVTIEEPKTQGNDAEVINNDSYWKISKRVCGDGKYYISIQTQNGSKALYKGDTVSASCVL